MRIKKISQTTPVQAQIVDGYSESTTDGYSANYVNEITADNSWQTISSNYGTLFYRKIAENTYHLIGNFTGYSAQFSISLPWTVPKQHVYLLAGSGTFYAKAFINANTSTIGITTGTGTSSTTYSLNGIVSVI